MQKLKLKQPTSTILAACLALVASAAMADTKTSDIGVSANVAASCSISALPIAFGAYDPLNTNSATGADVTATTTVTTTCTSGATPTLTLNEGVNKDSTSSPDEPVRRMVNGTDGTFMNYGLYSDTNHETPFKGTTGTAVAADGTAQTTTVYGLIPKGQAMTVGAYTDTVTATVTF